MTDHRPDTPTQEYDDVDRLFARLERAPVPDNLTARVLASTVRKTEATSAELAWPWMLAGLAAFGLLVIAGYQLGASLASSDALELVTALVYDYGLLASAPGDVLAALGDVIPWGMVAVAGLSVGLMVLAAGNVVSRVPSGLQRARSTTA